MATAVSKEGGRRGHRGVPPGAWTPELAAAGTLGAAGLAVARQPVLPREPPSPTLDPRELALGPPQGPWTLLFHLPQQPQQLASAPARAQPHQPQGAGSTPLTAPSGIALGDFGSAAAAAAAAMVARAAQNANYRLGQATGW